MSIVDKLLKLHHRQMRNDNVKSVLYFKRDRFYDLFSEIQKITRPAFAMPQAIWDSWIYKTMPKFVEGNSLRVLGYEIKALLR
jgi:hypothetical protein